MIPLVQVDAVVTGNGLFRVSVDCLGMHDPDVVVGFVSISSFLLDSNKLVSEDDEELEESEERDEEEDELELLLLEE